ncbi:ABC transporter substrate-binding protein [Paenibacillus aurantiacus]|uniref:ABC transporter substrate-binding protein n=1 Tax=Paenibacillus aurantiacus TaxID=1936118 RepID=A0ABV5KGR9_9BACL
MKKLILLLCSFAFILSGCQSNDSSAEEKPVTVLYSSMADFQKDYGFVLDKYKNINVIEFAPEIGNGIWNAMSFVNSADKDWDAERYMELVKKTKPDILFFPSAIYTSLLNENMLVDLSPYADQERLSGINPDIVQSIKAMGDGGLYAMSDGITSQALFYNKDVFKQLGVTEPTDYMSWENLLDLASRFPSREGVTGLYLPYYDAADLLLSIGKTEDLKWYDAVHRQALFESPAWEAIIEKVVGLYGSNAKQTFSGDLSQAFRDGKIAMTLNTYAFMKELNGSSQKSNWGIVTEPVNPNDQLSRKTMSFQYLNGINAASGEMEESLDVWSYINSASAAKIKNNAPTTLFIVPVRDALMADPDNRNVKAFSTLKPVFPQYATAIPRPVEVAAHNAINQILNQAISGQISVKEIRRKLQEDVTNAIQTTLQQTR